MDTNTQFKAYDRKRNEWFWFDILWGNTHGMGGGYTGMLPLGQEKRYGFNREDRIAVDIDECDLYPLEEKSYVVFKDGSYKWVDSKSSWEYENDSDWLVTIRLHEAPNDKPSAATGDASSNNAD